MSLLEAVDEYVSELTARCDVMYDNNPNILKQYESRKKQIADLAKELHDVTQNNIDLDERLEAQKQARSLPCHSP